MLSLPVTHYAGHITDLTSNDKISKTITVSIAFTRKFFKEYSIYFLLMSKKTDVAVAVL